MGIDMTRPIFIVGSDRSGTTLLRLMLTCHPDVAIPPESLFALALYPAWGSVRLESAAQINSLCDGLYGDELFREWHVARPILVETLIEHLPLSYAEFVGLVYMTYARQHQSSAVRWGDKNPRYAMHLPWLWHLFPDASVIHIIRDGRAVFSSFREANRKAGKTVWPEPVSAAARSWTIRLTRARQHRTNPNYTEVFYEKLVQASETELRQLCAFLDLEYDPGMLDFAEMNRQEELVPRHRLAWHGATLKPVQDSKVASWQDTLSPSDVARFELMAGHHLVSCGYSIRASTLGQFRLVNTLSLYGATLLRKLFGVRT